MSNTANPRLQFVQKMKDLIVDIDKIDKETPYRPTEPEWWLTMMDVRDKASQAIKKYEIREIKHKG